jgi:hypothetical protein
MRRAALGSFFSSKTAAAILVTTDESGLDEQRERTAALLFPSTLAHMFDYSLIRLLRWPSCSRCLRSSGVSFGRSMESVSLLSLPAALLEVKRVFVGSVERGVFLIAEVDTVNRVFRHIRAEAHLGYDPMLQVVAVEAHDVWPYSAAVHVLFMKPSLP